MPEHSLAVTHILATFMYVKHFCSYADMSAFFKHKYVLGPMDIYIFVAIHRRRGPSFTYKSNGYHLARLSLLS